MSDADKTEEITFEQQVMEQFAGLNRRIDSLDRRMDSIDTRLTALETKVDDRLRETRPIWEQVVSDVAAIKNVLELTNHKLDQVILDVAGVRAQCKMIDGRLSRLEQDAPAGQVK